MAPFLRPLARTAQPAAYPSLYLAKAHYMKWLQAHTHQTGQAELPMICTTRHAARAKNSRQMHRGVQK